MLPRLPLVALLLALPTLLAPVQAQTAPQCIAASNTGESLERVAASPERWDCRARAAALGPERVVLRLDAPAGG
ncbi:hypothetical protein [Qipengyuania sp.]|uniref:hypothetical protein n=1 Tax=Qipengyuania sp. TaxID=2004515 RepID=UPI0035C81F75